MFMYVESIGAPAPWARTIAGPPSGPSKRNSCRSIVRPARGDSPSRGSMALETHPAGRDDGLGAGREAFPGHQNAAEGASGDGGPHLGIDRCRVDLHLGTDRMAELVDLDAEQAERKNFLVIEPGH